MSLFQHRSASPQTCPSPSSGTCPPPSQGFRCFSLIFLSLETMNRVRSNDTHLALPAVAADALPAVETALDKSQHSMVDGAVETLSVRHNHRTKLRRPAVMSAPPRTSASASTGPLRQLQEHPNNKWLRLTCMIWWSEHPPRRTSPPSLVSSFRCWLCQSPTLCPFLVRSTLHYIPLIK